ncbi:hypothetical protein MMC10_007709 [Thelotrema lepadinum]|nr:hypothetical protein [Thelotrema lepadinum]
MTASDKDWSADQYLKFEAERSRPSWDLVTGMRRSFKRIVDLGCGPGNSTAILRTKWPKAHIVGMDSSRDMIKKAKKALPDIEFTIDDLNSYTPAEPADLLFSNAAYQWLDYDDRLPVLTRLLKTQPSGGVFAFQVPDNFSEPSHVSMRETAEQGPWAETLKNAHVPFRKGFQSPSELYNHLKPLCSDVNIWHTTYNHWLDDHQAIVEWVKGTGLRPFIDPLSPQHREKFLETYLEKIKKHYPLLHDGKVCLQYPRLFVIAVKA